MGLIMTSPLNHQHEDSGILRASETGMTFFSRSVIPVLDERSDGQIPESLHFRAVSHQVSHSQSLMQLQVCKERFQLRSGFVEFRGPKSPCEPVMVSLSNHQTGADSGLLRASETGMTFLSTLSFRFWTMRSDGQIPESFGLSLGFNLVISIFLFYPSTRLSATACSG